MSRGEVITVDGAEGGGSVLRVAIGLAVALQQPVRVVNIRGARKDPGLKAQHLAGLLATARLCDAQVEGAKLGSREVLFVPKRINKRKLRAEVPTAGAVGLVLQPLQIACLAAEHDVEVFVEGGGTFGKWAPPLPYLQHVNFALLTRFGYPAQLFVEREGFYPKGGARVRALFYRPRLKGPLVLEERGRLESVQGLSVAALGLKDAKVAERQARAALDALGSLDVDADADADVGVHLETRYVETASLGSAIVLWAKFERTILGADALGERGVRAEIVGRRAAEQLLTEIRSDATLDVHMADQIIPFVALYGGAFRCRELTEHVQVNLRVVEQLTGRTPRVEGMRIAFES